MVHRGSWMLSRRQLVIFACAATMWHGVNSFVIFPEPAYHHQRHERRIRTDPTNSILRRRHHHQQQQQLDDNDETSSSFIEAKDNEKEVAVEPDLFDYFDPLLSPHAYPKGIGSDNNVKSNGNSFKSLVRFDDDENGDEGSDSPSTASIAVSDDLGWSNTRESTTQTKKSYQLKKPFGISLPGGSDETVETISAGQSSIITESRPLVDILAVFDPTVSPHLYTKGSVPDVIIGDTDDDATTTILRSNSNTIDPPIKKETVRIGVLLMDHGSRSNASNDRLQELAQLYQQQFATSTSTSSNHDVQIIVQAAHMEIAVPSIEDGILALMNENVQEIICHPYFLSPGRHVVDDIPPLVQAAVTTLSVSIPVKITPPIGSKTMIMINAINALVNETSEYLSELKSR